MGVYVCACMCIWHLRHRELPFSCDLAGFGFAKRMAAAAPPHPNPAQPAQPKTGFYSFVDAFLSSEIYPSEKPFSPSLIEVIFSILHLTTLLHSVKPVAVGRVAYINLKHIYVYMHAYIHT